MRKRYFHLALSVSTGVGLAIPVCAQEADSGFELRTTVAAQSMYSHELTEPHRSGSPLDGAFAVTLNPTWKLNSRWSVNSAVQVHSVPYYQEEFSEKGHSVNTTLLQFNLSYARFWTNRSLVVRVGELTSAFGTFLSRYDAADNPLVGLPTAYGYYYKPVGFSGLAGAQVDATFGKADVRAQFTNSSPANARTVFDHDQYANWAGGAGYTIRQGFRVGASAYYGPYLDRHYRYFFPGEAAPHSLPAAAYGVDVQWGRGHWNVWGEWQRFRMDYKLIPVFTQHTGYGEVRRVINPRWYAAVRAEYLRASAFPGSQAYEVVAGFRPNRHQILKFGYHMEQGQEYSGTLGNTAMIQLVSSFRVLSLAKN